MLKYALAIRRAAASFILLFLLILSLQTDRFTGLVAYNFSYFQFVPSLMGVLAHPGWVAIAAPLILLLLSIVFGRAYCSFLCPLGMLAAIFSRATRKALPKTPPGFSKPCNTLRYGILAVTVASVFSGSLLLVDMLDPFSIFTRFITYLIKPLFCLINNQVTAVLYRLDIYLFPQISAVSAAPAVLAVTLVPLAAFFIMSCRWGKLYCNTICPVGAAIGIISRFSLVCMKISPSSCTSCGVCEAACKAGCIQSHGRVIDKTRCVMCFSCVAACPRGAITCALAFPAHEKKDVDMGLRKLLIGAAAAGAAFFVNRSPLGAGETTGSKQKLPIAPPGAFSLERLKKTCTACHLCIDACREKAIRPALFEYGFSWFMLPVMDYSEAHCFYWCDSTCAKVCPTGALITYPLEEKQLVQIGKATFIKERCIVETKKRDCGACAEVCQTHAVYTVEEGGLLMPRLNADLCIGCGHCSMVCPVAPDKAIFVESLAVHGIAKKRFSGQEHLKAVRTVPPEEDFPF